MEVIYFDMVVHQISRFMRWHIVVDMVVEVDICYVHSFEKSHQYPLSRPLEAFNLTNIANENSVGTSHRLISITLIESTHYP